MKQIITIVLIMFLILWYADTGSSAITNKNEKTLSAIKVKELADNGTLQKPVDYDKRYFTTQKVQYIQSKGLIPFTYKRDTLSTERLQYWSENN